MILGGSPNKTNESLDSGFYRGTELAVWCAEGVRHVPSIPFGSFRAWHTRTFTRPTPRLSRAPRIHTRPPPGARARV